MGKTLHGKCVFVIKESDSNGTELKGLPGIVGMNVLSDLKDIFMAIEGVKKMDRYIYGFKEAKVQRVLANIKMQTEALSCGDKIGFVKVAGRQAITIPPFSERVLEGRCQIPPKVSCQVLVEASTNVSLPKSVLIANVLARTADEKHMDAFVRGKLVEWQLPILIETFKVYKTSDAKTYGLSVVLKPIIDELKSVELEENRGDVALLVLPLLLPPTVYKIGQKVFRPSIDKAGKAFIDLQPVGTNMVEFLKQAESTKHHTFVMAMGNG
ncbi:hypothetical protein ROHU_015379 [Labeo rohita]|uniref:Uncharacterized protein n=1 Tax=Labeo rohita TaxID=84645 RepID=A0A498NPS8_LABRO|nr:hypothetical protein ROHU_015379 [Labeo rohita]